MLCINDSGGLYVKLFTAFQHAASRGGGPHRCCRLINGGSSTLQQPSQVPTFCQPHFPCLQAMEAQAQLADLNDEIELLKLRLDIAEQEKMEAADQVASESYSGTCLVLGCDRHATASRWCCCHTPMTYV